jgi:hypothetical protein
MLRLSSDLLGDIFRLACIDDGTTGCALSAVSQDIRDISSPFRYQAVALQGAHQICAFLALVVQLSSPETAPVPKFNLRTSTKRKAVRKVMPPLMQVRHLFLSDCAADVKGRKPGWTHWQEYQTGTLSNLKHAVTGPGTNSSAARSSSTMAEGAIRRLLAHLAPTLEHLCFNQETYSSVVLSPVLLPALVELTVRFRHNPSFIGVNQSDYAISLEILRDVPALRRLHMVSGYDNRHCVRLAILQQLPLRLTHLRLSDENDPPRPLELLSRMAGHATWPAHIETILLAPKTCFHPTCTISFYERSASSFSSDLRPRSRSPTNRTNLAEWHRAAISETDISSLVRSVDEDSAYDLRRLYVEWLDRVQGGYGCWVDGVSVFS